MLSAIRDAIVKKLDNDDRIEKLEAIIESQRRTQSFSNERNLHLHRRCETWRNSYKALKIEYQRVNKKCASRHKHINKLLALLGHETIKPYVQKINEDKAKANGHDVMKKTRIRHIREVMPKKAPVAESRQTR